jgi:hypothetical protein
MNACIYQIGTGVVTQLPDTFKVGPNLEPSIESITQDAGMQQAINSYGQVAGFKVGTPNHAAVWDAVNGIRDLTVMYPAGGGIVPTGFVMNSITAIDDSGDVAGFGTDGSGHTNQAFVIMHAIATPEPSTLFLATMGLVGLLAYAWRKRK